MTNVKSFNKTKVMRSNIENRKEIAPTSIMMKSSKHQLTMMLQLFFPFLLVTLTWDQSTCFVVGRSRTFQQRLNSSYPTNDRKKLFKLSRLYGESNTSTTGSSTTSSHHHHYHKKSKKGILSRTARESAVIVEWEPVSELERRIEDGMHYEHFDPLFVYGTNSSQEKAQHRNGNQNKGKKEWNNDWWRGWNVNRNDTYDHVESVFCGFTVTKEEIERLKSASPYDQQSDPPDDESTYQGDSI